jgi:uncharacterized membrane protein YgaE (UPF0421/DUF939 family)
MAQEVTIKVVATTKEAEENLKRLNSTLNEQNEILVELERELYKVEEAQKNTSKVNLAAQRKLTEQANHLKSAIKDQRISLKELNSERRTTKTALDDLSDSSLNQSTIIQGIDKVTGGYATKLKKLYLGLVEGAKGVKTFTLGLNGIKKAVIATGIGALVVALASIIAYWDDIKGLVSGVSSEQEKLLADTKATAAASKNILDATSASENSLKIQGKTEREIRDLKIQQTKEVISATEAVLEQQIQQAIAQEAAMQRNKDIAQGIITFLTLPITILLGTVDALTAALSYIPGLGDVATNLAGDFTGGIAGLIFDPEETKKEGEATIAETEKQLAELRNRRDGFKLQNQADANKAAEEAKALELKKAQELADLKNEIRDAEANTVAEQRIKELEDLQLHYDALILKAQEQNLATDELEKSKNESLLQLQADFDQQDVDAAKKKSDELDAIAEKQKNDAIKKKQAEISGKEALEQSYINTVSGFSNLLGQIAGENKQMQIASIIISQAANIAKIISNTTAANARALIELGPVAGAAAGVRQTISAGIGIASSVAAGAKAISQIKAADKGGSTVSDNGGSMPPAITAPSAPPSFNVVGASGTSQLAGVIANQSQQPIQAYVVSNDVTTAQSLDRNIIESVGI